MVRCESRGWFGCASDASERAARTERGALGMWFVANPENEPWSYFICYTLVTPRRVTRCVCIEILTLRDQRHTRHVLNLIGTPPRRPGPPRHVPHNKDTHSTEVSHTRHKLDTSSTQTLHTVCTRTFARHTCTLRRECRRFRVAPPLRGRAADSLRIEPAHSPSCAPLAPTLDVAPLGRATPTAA